MEEDPRVRNENIGELEANAAAEFVTTLSSLGPNWKGRIRVS